MNTPKALLYEAFGKVLYAVAMADGAIQYEEVHRLKEKLNAHPWAKQIVWSFNFEKSQLTPLNKPLRDAIDVFEDYGPCTEYAYFIEVLEEVAEAFGGTVPQEREVIDFLKEELIETLNGEELPSEL